MRLRVRRAVRSIVTYFNRYCVMFYRSILMLLSSLFSERIARSYASDSSDVVASWRHNFEFSRNWSQNCEKSKNRSCIGCAHNFVQIAEIVFFFKINRILLSLWKQMCTYIFLRKSLYSAGSIVKFRIESPKMARNLSATKVTQEVNFRKYLTDFVHGRDSSCVSTLQFSSAASDGATADRQIPNRTFSSNS